LDRREALAVERLRAIRAPSIARCGVRPGRRATEVIAQDDTRSKAVAWRKKAETGAAGTVPNRRNAHWQGMGPESPRSSGDSRSSRRGRRSETPGHRSGPTPPRQEYGKRWRSQRQPPTISGRLPPLESNGSADCFRGSPRRRSRLRAPRLEYRAPRGQPGRSAWIPADRGPNRATSRGEDTYRGRQ